MPKRKKHDPRPENLKATKLKKLKIGDQFRFASKAPTEALCTVIEGPAYKKTKTVTYRSGKGKEHTAAADRHVIKSPIPLQKLPIGTQFRFAAAQLSHAGLCSVSDEPPEKYTDPAGKKCMRIFISNEQGQTDSMPGTVLVHPELPEKK